MSTTMISTLERCADTAPVTALNGSGTVQVPCILARGHSGGHEPYRDITDPLVCNDVNTRAQRFCRRVKGHEGRHVSASGARSFRWEPESYDAAFASFEDVRFDHQGERPVRAVEPVAPRRCPAVHEELGQCIELDGHYPYPPTHQALLPGGARYGWIDELTPEIGADTKEEQVPENERAAGQSLGGRLRAAIQHRVTLEMEMIQAEAELETLLREVEKS